MYVFLRYMRGRVTYDQLNVVVDSFNTALTAKYKILGQSLKTLNNHSRKLQERFKNQETKDTKGSKDGKGAKFSKDAKEKLCGQKLNGLVDLINEIKCFLILYKPYL